MPRKKETQTRYQQLDEMFEVPMVVAAFILLAIIIIQQVIDPSGFFALFLNMLDWIIWFGFFAELVILTYYAPDKKKHLVSHWYDVLIVLIPILRLTRIVAVFGVLELEQVLARFLRISSGVGEGNSFLVRVFALLSKNIHEARRFIIEHKFNYIFGTLFLIILFLGSLAAVVEMNTVNANIRSIGDGIWWSIVSITTVGYGDKYPITFVGRSIGVILMTIGVATYSLLTANIASFLLGEKDERDRNSLNKKIQKLDEKLDAIQKELHALNNK